MGITALVVLGVVSGVVLLLVVLRLNGEVADVRHDSCTAIADARVQLALLDAKAGLEQVPLPPNCAP